MRPSRRAGSEPIGPVIPPRRPPVEEVEGLCLHVVGLDLTAFHHVEDNRSTRSFSSCRPSCRIFSRKSLASVGSAASM